MTYVREQTSAELAAHMRRLKKMAGWFDPLADRLWQEVEALKAENDEACKDLQNLRTDNAQLIYALKQQEQSYLVLRDERDELRAEVAGLKTGYEAYERVNAELKAECARSTEREILQLAEIEALRKALVGILDLYDTDEGCRSLPQYINGRAAMGRGEQP